MQTIFIMSRPTRGFTLVLLQGRLDVNVASVGSMSPYTEIAYGATTVTSRRGSTQTPIWNEAFNFEYTENVLEITVFHKPMFSRPVELGKCKIRAEEGTGWFEIRKETSKTGSIRIALKDENNSSFYDTHSASGEEILKKLSELEMQKEELQFYKNNYKVKIEKLRTEKKKVLESQVKEQAKSAKYCEIQLNRRKLALAEEQAELELEKLILTGEWEELESLREEIEKLKSEVNQEYCSRQKEKHKAKIERKLSQMRTKKKGYQDIPLRTLEWTN